MNIPIFFFGYLLGYMLCAYALDYGVTYYRNLHASRTWVLRRGWQGRLLFSPRFGRITIALISLAWWYLIGGALVKTFREKREEFDHNRLRHCKDPLYQWCEGPCPLYFKITINRCEEGHPYNWWCITSILCHIRCDPYHRLDWCQEVEFE